MITKNVDVDVQFQTFLLRHHHYHKHQKLVSQQLKSVQSSVCLLVKVYTVATILIASCEHTQPLLTLTLPPCPTANGPFLYHTKIGTELCVCFKTESSMCGSFRS